MCFALPKQIKKIEGSSATMEDTTVAELGDICAKVGDYLLVAGPLAIEKIPKKKALQMRQMIKPSI